MTHSLLSSRFVNSADEIPRLHPYGTIPLIKTQSIPAEDLQAVGAINGKVGWFLRPEKHHNLDLLKDVLPRFAQRTVTPEIPDLIPSSSWHSSLANLLLQSSWQKLSQPFFAFWGGCEECGKKYRLECHEKWSYDHENQIQRLSGLRSLCHDCHMTQHLGLANERGILGSVMQRHGMINRLFEHELQSVIDMAMDKWEVRSRMDWTICLAGIKDTTLRLNGGVIQVAADTVQASKGNRTITTRITGMRIAPDPDGKRLCLVSL